jgi:hypothetical protein
LTDKNNEEYLLYEGYPNLTGQGKFSLTNFCDETCYLDGVVPANLKISINKASVALTSLTWQTVSAGTKSSSLKSQQDAYKISQLNQKIKAGGGKWVAGATSVSGLTYTQKKKLFSTKDGKPADSLPNLQGFEYYKGGIFEIKDSTAPKTSTKTDDSNIIVPDSFDWRNVHGENWMTPVKNQGGAETCQKFAAIGSLESKINIYYNKHINLNLSEQMFNDCSWPAPLGSTIQRYIYEIKEAACSSYGYPKSWLCYFMKVGAVDEQADTYSDIGTINGTKKCDESNIANDWQGRLWAVNNFNVNKGLDNQNNPLPTNVNEIGMKKMLITNGPAYAEIGSWSHSMVLGGFGVAKQGDFLYFDSYNNPVTIVAGDPMIGQKYWIFKNSWGSNWGEQEQGYLKFLTPYENLSSLAEPIGPFTPPTNHAYWPAGFDNTVKCVDKDADSYCNWGISEQPPAGTVCPATCKKSAGKFIKDCNDADNKLGSFISENNLNCASILAPVLYHSADTNRDYKISATELGRVVSFYNAGGYHVDGLTSDGFAPGHVTNPSTTVYHSADTNKDYKISATELGRVTTLYNAGGYKVDSSTSDGFAPITATKTEEPEMAPAPEPPAPSILAPETLPAPTPETPPDLEAVATPVISNVRLDKKLGDTWTVGEPYYVYWDFANIPTDLGLEYKVSFHPVNGGPDVSFTTPASIESSYPYKSARLQPSTRFLGGPYTLLIQLVNGNGTLYGDGSIEAQSDRTFTVVSSVSQKGANQLANIFSAVTSWFKSFVR